MGPVLLSSSFRIAILGDESEEPSSTYARLLCLSTSTAGGIRLLEERIRGIKCRKSLCKFGVCQETKE
jgi:hypothetical protein